MSSAKRRKALVVCAETKPQATANLASFFVTGESNRIVVTQLDDCYVKNNLASAFVLINGVQIDDLIRAPLVGLEFLPSNIFLGGTTTMRINITNPNAFALTNVRFNDTFDQTPSGVLLSPGVALGGAGCPQLTIQASGNLILPASTFAAGQFCSYSVTVQGVLGRSTSDYVVAFADFTNPGISNVGVLSIRGPPYVNLSFTPSTISAGNNNTVMGMVVRNDNLIDISGVSINYTVPAGLTIVEYPVASPGCPIFQAPPIPPVVGPQVITATGSLSPGILCQYQFNAYGTGSSLSSFSVSSLNAPFVISNIANLTFTDAPGLTKAYSAPSVVVGGTVNMIITISNPLSSAQLMSFSDVLPNGLQVLSNGSVVPSSCPSITNTLNSVTLTSSSVAAFATCTYTIPVLGTVAARTFNSMSVTMGPGPIFTESSVSNVELFVMGAAQSSKSYSSSSVAQGTGRTILTITITNPNALALTGVNFTDSLVSRGMAVTTPAPLSFVAGGGNCISAQVGAGGSFLMLSNGVVPALSSCTYIVEVNASTASSNLSSGTVNTFQVTTTNGPTGSNATATIYVMAVGDCCFDEL